MGTLICWWGERSHIKVKGHLRSSCKIGWKCKSGLIWKIEDRLEPTWFIDTLWGLLYAHVVKGHKPRSKVIRGQVVDGLRVKFTSFEKLRSNWNQTWFIDKVWDCLNVHLVKGHTKVKGHQWSSCKMGSKCKIHLIWKVKVRLVPNFVYLFDIGTFTCSWGQRSQMKVKVHVRSMYKTAWKCKIWLICKIEHQLEPFDPSRCGIEVKCQFASSTNCEGRRH